MSRLVATDGSLFFFPKPIGDLAEMTTDILIPRFRRGFLLSGSILQAFRAGHSTAGGYDTSPVPLDVSLRGAKRRGNLAVPGRIVGKLSAKTQLPSRDSHVASLLGMTNLFVLRRRITTAIPATAYGAH